jgi:hypothetical protein
VTRPTRRLERLLRDDDRDGVADAVVAYGEDGRAERLEIDTDGDLVIDRRETRPSDPAVDPDEHRDGKAAQMSHIEH